MTTKSDIITGAYSIMRISGQTVTPGGTELELALDRLEDMAAEFFGRNINVNYNFEENPDLDSLHNMERKFWYPFKINLAARLLADYGKQLNPVLMSNLKSSTSFLYASTAPTKETQYPSRMPIGSSNSLQSRRHRKFFTPSDEAPLSAETITMYIGDIQSFSESFVAYLNDGETISSYTITADTGLTVTTSANATPLITYTISAVGTSDGNTLALLQLKIIVTTSDGRVEIRIKNFKLLSSTIEGD